MQCSRCGVMNRKYDDECFACGEALRMVPDYNPIEDDILLQVQSALSDPTPKYEQEKRGSRDASGTMGNKISDRRIKGGNDGGISGETGRLRHTTDLSPEELELKRRRQYIRKKEIARRQRQMLLAFAIAVGLLLGVIGYVLYSNSYAGIVGKANSLSQTGEYTTAISNYNRAITKSSSKIEAYEGLASLYVMMEDLPQAQIVLQQGVDTNPEKVDMFHLMIDFYLLTNQAFEIMPFIKTCKNEDVLDKLSNYYVEEPEFSLEAKTYEDVQELTLTTIEDGIFYTIDGSEVSANGIPYSGPIQISEGTTIVQAFSYSEMGIPSVVITKEYVVELPIEGAPIVTPSTGQYDEATNITVQVPSGYTAHYTMDGSVPDANSSVYTGAIVMPKGNTIFSVVLINGSGRTSDVTKRNYILS